MTATRPLAFMAVLLLSYAAASAKEATPATSSRNEVVQPIGGGQPVTTITVKRCPDGYELVIRANGRRGCAKDVLPAND